VRATESDHPFDFFAAQDAAFGGLNGFSFVRHGKHSFGNGWAIGNTLRSKSNPARKSSKQSALALTPIYWETKSASGIDSCPLTIRALCQGEATKDTFCKGIFFKPVYSSIAPTIL
jgi:hypothetical protein